jgi:ribosomal protein L11 methyltransferase
MPPADKFQKRLVIRGDSSALDLASSLLFDAGAAGLAEEEGALIAYPRDSEEFERFRLVLEEVRKSADEALQVVPEAVDPSWESEWLKYLIPQKISPSFTLCPVGSSPPDAESTAIWFAPCASFGSGEHSTTQLAATFVEQHVRAHPGIRCLDVGAGSGVLSLVAVKSGAEHVLAVDIDDVSVQSARENALLNACEHQITVAKGSADLARETFDLVVANINTPTLLELHRDLAARVSKKGVLALTGLLEEDIQNVRAALEGQRLHLSQEHLQDGWALLLFRPQLHF